MASQEGGGLLKNLVEVVKEFEPPPADPLCVSLSMPIAQFKLQHNESMVYQDLSGPIATIILSHYTVALHFVALHFPGLWRGVAGGSRYTP